MGVIKDVFKQFLLMWKIFGVENHSLEMEMDDLWWQMGFEDFAHFLKAFLKIVWRLFRKVFKKAYRKLLKAS